MQSMECCQAYAGGGEGAGRSREARGGFGGVFRSSSQWRISTMVQEATITASAINITCGAIIT